MSKFKSALKHAVQGLLGDAAGASRTHCGDRGPRPGKNRHLRRRGRYFEQLETRDLLASVVLQAVSADGGTKLSLTYDVLAPTQAFNVGFYRSADAVFGGDTQLDTVAISSLADRTVGRHVKTFNIGGGPNQVALPGAGAGEVNEDYSLLAVASPAVAGQESTAVFAGVYHAQASGVFVHGGEGADSVLIDAIHRVTLNGVRKSYAAADVTGFFIRAHGGNDTLNAATAAKAVWADGGAGDDTLTGAAAADTLLGGLGDDNLRGGPGDDSIDGGTGRDVALYSGLASSYSIVHSDGVVQVIDLAPTVNGDDRADSLSNGEFARFLDTEIDLLPPVGNSPPVANPDTLLIDEDGGAVIAAVLANDTDVDASDTKRVVSVNSAGVRGVVQIPADGTGVLFYTNNSYTFLRAGETLTEFIAYTMADSAGAQSSSTLVVTVTGANAVPLAVADARTISEDDGPSTVGVLANDTDVDVGDTKTVVSINGSGRPAGFEIVVNGEVTYPVAIPEIPPVLGSISISPDGQGVVYSPGIAFQNLRGSQTATDCFEYTLADGSGAQSKNWVTITVVGANDAPIAEPDALTVAKNSAPATINVLTNDFDVDSGDTKTVASINTTGLLGTATISADGKSVVYSAGSAFSGLPEGQTATETFSYTMVDGLGSHSTATVTVLISGLNTPPTAVADASSATENGAPILINVLANDFDPDAGDTKRVVSVNGAGLQGAVSVAPGGAEVIYSIGNAFQTLAAGATAIETFSYTMVDGGGAQSTTTVVVTVTGANDSPVAVANAATASEDGVPIVVDVLANDADVDVGDTRAVVAVNVTGLQGAVSIAPGGTGVVYDVGNAFQNLRAGAIATTTFTYTMADAAAAQSTATVTVTVTGVNDTPVAVANTLTVTEDAAATTILVLANDTDVDVGDSLRVVSVNTAGLLGTATVAANGASVTYSVGSAFQHLIAGQTATETFSYTMADAAGGQSTASVTVTITGLTDGPKAVNDNVSAAEDGGPIVISVLANDVNDLNPGDSLTITSIDGAGLYTAPILGFFDGAPQLIGFHPGFPRMLGQASIAVEGHRIVYTPLQSLNAGETGMDQFKYTITGTGGGTSTGVVTITVAGASDAPTAADDSGTVAANGAPLTLNVLANDTDPDTRIDPPAPPIPPSPFSELIYDPTPADVPDTKTVVAVNGSGLQGSVAIAAGGTSVVYSVGGGLLNLAYGTTAIETFTYTMQDSAQAQSTATVTVTVTGTNQTPTARADVAAAVEDGAPVTIDVLANDSDGDVPFGDSFSIIAVQSGGIQGTLSIAPDGSNLTYSVGSGFQNLRAGQVATETFSYTIADASGATATATVTATITGVNDAPLAVANNLSLSEDAPPTTINVLANDTDADTGDTATIVAVSTAGLQGTVTFAPGGSAVIYTVATAFQSLLAGQSATEVFTYTVEDTFGAQATATVTVVIIGANEPVIYINPPPPPPGATVGTANDDNIVGTAAADIIYGEFGDDEISGGGGADTIFGGADRDTIIGGAGNDVINGGSDRDDLTGGTGADIFKYYLASESTVAESDKIKDFKASEGDKIDLSLIDASTTVGDNNAFVLSSSFTMIAGQLVITTTSAGVYWVMGDVNGDGIADLQIEVRSSVALVAANFIL